MSTRLQGFLFFLLHSLNPTFFMVGLERMHGLGCLNFMFYNPKVIEKILLLSSLNQSFRQLSMLSPTWISVLGLTSWQCLQYICSVPVGLCYCVNCLMLWHCNWNSCLLMQDGQRTDIEGILHSCC